MKDFFTLDKQLCFAVYETAGEFTKLYTSALQPFGLTYPQYLVLLALWEKDGVTAKELGERLNLGTGTLTPMISRMISNGWLRKERSKADERKVYIFLEEKARKEKEVITQNVGEAIQACSIQLEEYEELMELLGKLKFKLRSRVLR
ncbi:MULTISPECIES: MarR family winged helix-turn-helix transcriptional regulator [Cytobacillus]|uniref:MarR family transcriptional regulator n=1 Tax=Cytobacillus oceanisediminis 2691 TaxID=1196031 RepID=A0A160M7Y7_9BACI|nr:MULTISPECIES: MarR family transcriptional regulator [Cytobacillus]MBY0155903.1 MarR family transcriptional regulator [Cytobacillus firmus]AND38660.1 MarR family transcriptional regulator [Cytobacillus oceanisediminis 2691]MCM3241768.1 MarR family transcriptional regulator [Cytobacillus oceanisediminis]MCM3390851.1 MarR family transcriptional regulator [Cytobacillus oceanisediminis]MCM3404018.1 MarR family transcriptional regulator [Cytobacillus oceanisediminis]